MKIIKRKGAKRKIKKVKKPVVAKPVVHRSVEWLAKVGYGETAGLYPQKSASAGPEASIYDPTTWDSGSFSDLQAGRANIMSVALRNSGVKAVVPGKDKIPQQAWKFNLDAAKFSLKYPAPGNYLFIRQKGVGNQKPPKKAGYGQGNPLISYGPFRNVGGGDVPKGNKTYIDIYLS